jgi:hypothetical protein
MSRIRAEFVFEKNNMIPKDVIVFAHVISSRNASSRRRGLQVTVNRVESIKLREWARKAVNIHPCLSLNNTPAIHVCNKFFAHKYKIVYSCHFLIRWFAELILFITCTNLWSWVPIARACSQGYNNYHKAEYWKNKLYGSTLTYYFNLQEISP